jgi:hypothetical protein
MYEGKWKEIRGDVKWWGKITDDDLDKSMETWISSQDSPTALRLCQRNGAEEIDLRMKEFETQPQSRLSRVSNNTCFCLSDLPGRRAHQQCGNSGVLRGLAFGGRTDRIQRQLKGVKNEIDNEISGGGCIGFHAIAG